MHRRRPHSSEVRFLEQVWNVVTTIVELQMSANVLEPASAGKSLKCRRLSVSELSQAQKKGRRQEEAGERTAETHAVRRTDSTLVFG